MSIVVYRYGLLAPTVGGEIVAEQVWRAHRYQNTLIEIEHERRERASVIVDQHDVTAPIIARIEHDEGRLAEARASMKAQHAEARAKRGVASPQEREAIKVLVARLRDARAELKLARAEARADAVVAAGLATVTDAAHTRSLAARAACGVYWGTYLLIEQAVDAARRSPTPPRFRRWDGEGAVAVQIQGGLPVADIFGDDTRIRISDPRQVDGRGGKALPRLSLRVGSDGRAPVWAEWPVILHRPLPEMAVVKWAKVLRQRVAGRDVWSLHLTLNMPDPVPLRSAGVVAVDLGWRRAGETRRAGGWCDDAGEGAEIMMDPAIISMLEKAKSLRSIRDRNQNAMHAELVAWSESAEALPAEHVERMAYLPQWQAAGRFAALAIWWRDHRIDGDEEMFSRLEAWRRQDKHLWLWEANARRKAIARRRDGYRVLAARLAERYHTLVIERLALDEMARIPAPESDKESHPQARSQRVETAPSELRAALVNAFRRRGGDVVTVPAGGPASTLLESFRERSGAEEMPGTARVSRFSKLRAKRSAAMRSDGTAMGPLENGL